MDNEWAERSTVTNKKPEMRKVISAHLAEDITAALRDRLTASQLDELKGPLSAAVGEVAEKLAVRIRESLEQTGRTPG